MTKESRLKIIFKASIVAIAVNIALGIFKAIVGVISNSIAITNDAINNFTDAGSGLVTVLSSYFAGKNADRKHPFGYGRTEYLGTLLIGVLILYAGITSFAESVKSIIHPEAAEYATVSLIIIAVAIAAKIMLTIFISRAGKKANSDSLIAASKESLGDITISVATLVAAFIFIFTGVSIEAWLGAVIALLISKAGAEVLLETVSKLLGESGDAALVRDIKAAIREHENVKGAYDLILHNYGPEDYMGSVHIEVEDSLPMNRFDELSREIEADIFEKFGVYLSAIGVYSVNTMDTEIIAVREDVKSIALGIEHVNQLHGFYINQEKKIMQFDLVISFGAADRKKVFEEAISRINEKYPEYKVNAGMDTDYNEL